MKLSEPDFERRNNTKQPTLGKLRTFFCQFLLSPSFGREFTAKYTLVFDLIEHSLTNFLLLSAKVLVFFFFFFLGGGGVRIT